MSIYTIDPKTLRKATPRSEPAKNEDKQVQQTMLDFDGEDYTAGKLGKVDGEKFKYYLERLDANASTATFNHTTKYRVVTVIQGNLTVNYNDTTVLLREGNTLEIPPGNHTFLALSGSVVFSVVQDSKYFDKLTQVGEPTAGIKTVDYIYTPASRRKSKAKEQLAAMFPQPEAPQVIPTGASQEGINNMPVMHFDE